MTEAKHPVKATETTLSIVEELRSNGPSRVTELADDIAISKSAVHNHLSTLRDYGYVIKEGESYRLSLKFLDIGGRLRRRMAIYKVAEPEVNRLANQTGELTNLFTEEQGMGVYLYRSKGSNALDFDTYAGKRKYLHATAVGKSILASLPKERVHEIIDEHGLPAQTENTISDREELMTELEATKDRGFSMDDEETTPGVRCVAAPIKTDGEVHGAISISAPTSRLRGEKFETEYPNEVKSGANVIELNLKYPP